MRIKKNSILITLLFVLSIGLIVMIRNNYQINSELKECNLKLLEKKDCIRFCYLGNNSMS